MINIPKIGHIYPIFILLSFIIPFIIIYFRNKDKYKSEYLFYGFLTVFICSVAGGFLFHFFTNNFAFGLSSYGGAIGFIIAAFLYPKLVSSEKYTNISDELCQKQHKHLRNEFLIHIPLLYSISKIACGLNGCCHGFEYSGLISVSYNGINSYFPVQFIETICFFLIYLAGVTLLENNKNKVLIILMISAMSKAALEYFRYGYSGININQIVSILFVVATIIILIKRRESNGKTTN